MKLSRKEDMVTKITSSSFQSAVLKSEMPMLVFFKNGKPVD